MSNETDKTGGRVEPTGGMPTGSRSHLAVWVSPKVIDTPIVSKTGKGFPVSRESAHRHWACL